MTEAINDEKPKINWFARHKILTGIIIVFILFAIGGAATDKGKDASTKSIATNNQPVEQANTADPSAQETTQPTIPAEYSSALAKAKSYSDTQHMSKQGLYDQLTSEYGEKFTAPAAQYAIDNLVADYNANALAKAKSYQNLQHMSPAAIHDQLTSQYGEKFTVAEADYAIANLNK
jgi:hypothetical protein